MRNYIISLILFGSILTSITAASQTNNFNIRIAPLSLVDIYSGSCYKGGIEFKFFKNNSMSLEGGGYFKNFNGLQNIKGHVVDMGIRHYLENDLQNNGIYLSLNYFYKEQSFNYKDSILLTPAYFKEYRVHKFINCINLNFGVCSISEQNLFIDCYAGLGVRLKKVNSTLTPDEVDTAKEYNDSQSLFFMVTPGKFIWPNINLGVRIGYIIK